MLPRCSSSFMCMHYALLSGSEEVKGNRSESSGPWIFCQAGSERMKGTGYVLRENQQKVIISRENKWRAKVGLVTCTISLPDSLWRHSCQPL